MITVLAEICRLEIPELLARLQTKETGLSETEVKPRVEKYGQNTLVSQKETPAIIEFLNNFTDPLVLTLLVIGLVSYLMGSVTDAIIIGTMVLTSASLNFFQEYKASKATQALLSTVAHTAMVYRNGSTIEIPVAGLVPGDVIELNAGDLIPADGRVIEATDFFVNQASLTGESFPVEKSDIPIEAGANDLVAMTNIVFAGTGVHTGRAKVVIVATGRSSQLGNLNQAMHQAENRDEFSKSLRSFSLMIMKIIGIFVVIIFGVTSLWQNDLWKSVSFSVAIAVGLTPEFLPMIMSVTMGRGSRAMVKKGVIVKKLTAIPTFGSMDVLCTDKTGTLTENHIAVISFVDIDGNKSEETWRLAYLNSYFQSGITNPMDEAVIEYGNKPHKNCKKIDEVPFDFERRRLTVVVETSEDKIEMITKGAPESILPIASKYLSGQETKVLTKSAAEKFNQTYRNLSLQGYRVLAIAEKAIESSKTKFSTTDEEDCVFVGFIAFIDPAKKGVREALDELEALHIELKVISGDNELVTQKICNDVDISVLGTMLGDEVDQLTDCALAKKVEQVTIFARFNPVQKNRVIQALQRNGHVVGYLGDGINDAPSLMTADVGISVANAVDVAREAADLVLTKKSLTRLVLGVKEGRKTFGNTMKYILMGLSSNFGNMFSMLGGVIFLPFLPMLPLQILLNNFLYDLSQIMIPGDNVDEEYILNPKRMNLKYIKKFMLLFGPVSSLFDFLTFWILYKLYSGNQAAFQTGWFMESLATQALVIYVIRTRKVPFWKSKPSWGLIIASVGVMILGWGLHLLPFGQYFSLTRLPLEVMVLLGGVVVCYLIAAEVMNWIYHRILKTDAYVA